MSQSMKDKTKASRRVGRPSLLPKLKAELFTMIDAEGLGPGDRLDSEKQLCKRFGVSRPSIRGALEELAREGLVVSLPGRGHYLTEQKRAVSSPGVVVCLAGTLQPGSLWNHPHVAGILNGLQDVLEQQGRRLLVEARGSEQRQVRAIVQPYLSDLAGLVLMPLGPQTGEQMLSETPDVPRVVVGRSVAEELAPSVSVDHVGSLDRATSALLNMGHTGIAFLEHSGASIAALQREKGYRRAMETRLGCVDESMVMGHVPPELSVIRRALGQLIARPDVTALLVTSLPGALASALQLAADAGRNVPGNLSIIAMDDSPQTTELTPAISAVRQPLGELGRISGHMLTSLLQGRLPQPARVVLESELVLRDSTAAVDVEN